jgi:hypothetical protein
MKSYWFVCLFVAVCALGAHADTILSDGFEGPSYLPGYGISSPDWLANSRHTYWAGTSFWIASDDRFHSGSQSARRMLEYSDNNTWNEAVYTPPTALVFPEQEVSYKADLLFSQINNNSGQAKMGIQLYGKDAANTRQLIAAFVLGNDTEGTIDGFEMTTFKNGEYITQTSLQNTSLENWYNMEIRASLATNAVSFLLDGSPLGSGSFDTSIAFDTVSLVCWKHNYSAFYPDTHVPYYDDVMVSSIPEPASLLILTLGGILAIRKK